MQPEGLGSAVSSASRIWGKAAAEIEFGAFQPQNMTSGGNNFDNSSENQLAKFLTLPDFRGVIISGGNSPGYMLRIVTDIGPNQPSADS